MPASVDVLLEALEYIRVFHGKTFVVRCDAGLSADANWDLARDVALMRSVGIRTVVVHPGVPAPAANGELDAPAHHRLVLAMAPHTRAVGLSGSDGAPRCLFARDAAGAVVAQTDLIEHLIDDYAVVVEALGVDEAGDVRVVDADDAALRVAIELRAYKLLFVTGTGNLLAGDGRQVSELRATDDVLSRLRIDSVKPGQVDVAFKALQAGVRFAHFLPADVSHALLIELFTDAGYGAKLWNDQDWTLDPGGLMLREDG